jgi:hypothetical protein
MARTPKNDADASAADREKANLEHQRLMDESKPTPTQAEIDAAKLGTFDNDDKEDDGSAPKEDAEVQSRAVRSEHAAPYRNRAAKTE